MDPTDQNNQQTIQMPEVVLFEPEIPPNTGNIARLCAATRTPLHLIHPLGFRLDERAVRRAGLDYWPEVNMTDWQNLDALIDARAERGRWWVTKHGRMSYHEADFRPGDLLIFGKESAGLPPKWTSAEPERCIRLPMPNTAVRSLNLATAAAIVLYESLRQLNLLEGSGGVSPP